MNKFETTGLENKSPACRALAVKALKQNFSSCTDLGFGV